MTDLQMPQFLFPGMADRPSWEEALSVMERFPRMRYMGSKYRLLNWIAGVLGKIEFHSVLDAFSGSGAVSYLLKAAGKQVTSNDALGFPYRITEAAVENSKTLVSDDVLEAVTRSDTPSPTFIHDTFAGIFFMPEDLRFLDRVWGNLDRLQNRHQKAILIASLIRACAKRQPRGVFTVAGDPERYKDSRRDLQLNIREHFLEGVQLYNAAVFDNGSKNRALQGDVFDVDPAGFDLVYLDPPYVPLSDDNCYIKRYHFLEGVSCYWRGVEILESSRVKKIKKPFTPFSYRRTAVEAFEKLFRRFERSTLVLSYSSNAFPSLGELTAIMKRFKPEVTVHSRPHRYHFGTHASAVRNSVTEYLIVGK